MLTRMEEVRAQVAERDELIEIIAIALLTRKNVFTGTCAGVITSWMRWKKPAAKSCPPFPL